MINSKVKLVIWDLDETFWKGTLSEGKVQKVDKNFNIVKSLIDRGIMCSIVSKNNYCDVEKVLKDWKIWDYFIFPHISWTPKGEQVKHLLKQCSLRPENTLFIDDNISNLKEAEFYNPHIMTELPDILNSEFLNNEFLKGKNDLSHSRLKQYKVLEVRSAEELTYSSNEDFLRDSNIKILIIKDCTNYIDRIVELIQRTNQLNFTKIRLNTDEINKILSDKTYSCACIHVSDKFGDYGIVGFYALKSNILKHFVFSCRTIGFGIENYLYKKLGYPKINIINPVSTELEKEYAEKIDWIHEEKNNNTLSNTNISKDAFLMIAGCDLEQACAYLDSKFEIHKEFNTIVNGKEIRTSDTSQLINMIELKESEKQNLCEHLPFFEKSISFNSKIFSGKFKTIVFSVVDDFIRGIWKYKKSNYEIGYGGYYDQDVFLSKLSEDEKQYLIENFEFIGKEKASVFKNNLEKIINMINPDTHIILINGIDIDISEWIGIERVNRNREMNAIVDELVKKYKNVDLLDMRTIVTSKKSLPNKDNRHFDRNTYYKIALKLSEMTAGNSTLCVKNYTIVETQKLIKKILSKL